MDRTEGFSILIPTWNNLPYLKLCLRSIQKYSELLHQIIVIVNEGKDGTYDWLKENTDVECIYFEENKGICVALNQGAKLAKKDHIVYLNDDMYVLPGWDQEISKEVGTIGHHDFFLSATMIEPTETGNPCVIVKNFGDKIENFEEKALLSTFKDLGKEDWSGATWPPNIIHKSLWEKVGGMSEEFSPGFYSDPDLSRKLWEVGVRYFKGLGKSRVYHFGSKSTGKTKLNKGSATFLEKWGITANTFTKYYLKRGAQFTGPLPEPKVPGAKKLGNFIKKKMQ